MIDRMKAVDEAGVASAELGQVTLDGPDGVAITLTPQAAAETGRRLIAAAEAAVAQGEKDGESSVREAPSGGDDAG